MGGNITAAEDIVQEAYLRAWRYQDSFDPKRSGMKTWFNTILYNTLRDSQRSYQQQEEGCDDVDIFFEENSLKSIAEHLPLIDDEIEKLRNEKFKRILRLYYILGYTSKEIASVEEGVTITNVTTICSRFKNNLDNLKM